MQADTIVGMDLSDPLTSLVTTLEGQLLRVLAGTTKPLTGAAVARLVRDSSPAGVRLGLKRLVADGTVYCDPVGGSLTYVANREHLLWSTIERMIEDANTVLESLESRIVEALQAELSDELFAGMTLAVFGSVARRQSDRSSDVDLLVVFPDGTEPSLMQIVSDLLQERVPTWTGNDCSVYSLDRSRLSELERLEDPMIDSWKADARTFHGPEVRALLSHRQHA